MELKNITSREGGSVLTDKLNVLIIDDEEMVGDMLKDFLEDCGFNVKTALTGKDGLDLVSEVKFHVAIVDMRLPDMIGNDFIIKANEMQSNIKYFVHTGSHEYRLPEKLISIGMSGESILYKPITDMNLILQAIKDQLEK
jgi:YesN/AraC family two-component response regulator